MNSFHIFLRGTVVASVLLVGHIFAFDAKKILLNTSIGATKLQPVVVTQAKKEYGDNVASVAATGFYVLQRVNNNCRLEMKKKSNGQSSMTRIAADAAGYAAIDRALRFIENTADGYGINQKAIIKKAKEYLPEKGGNIVEGVLPVVVETVHGFVVETATTAASEYVANIKPGSSSTL